MTTYKTDQRRVAHHGREFHFVSYQGATADPRREQAETPAAWYLMAAGKRWRVMLQDPDQSEDDLDHQLHDWLDENVFAGPRNAAPASTPDTASKRANRQASA